MLLMCKDINEPNEQLYIPLENVAGIVSYDSNTTIHLINAISTTLGSVITSVDLGTIDVETITRNNIPLVRLK